MSQSKKVVFQCTFSQFKLISAIISYFLNIFYISEHTMSDSNNGNPKLKDKPKDKLKTITVEQGKIVLFQQ